MNGKCYLLYYQAQGFSTEGKKENKEKIFSKNKIELSRIAF